MVFRWLRIKLGRKFMFFSQVRCNILFKNNIQKNTDRKPSIRGYLPLNFLIWHFANFNDLIVWGQIILIVDTDRWSIAASFYSVLWAPVINAVQPNWNSFHYHFNQSGFHLTTDLDPSRLDFIADFLWSFNSGFLTYIDKKKCNQKFVATW